MKVAKLKNKNIKQNDKLELKPEEYSVKKILITLGIVIIVFLIFYLITTLVVKPAKKEEQKNDTYVNFDSTLITLDHLLDRKDNEYYVLAIKTDSKVNNYEIYNRYITTYKAKENSLKIYNVDLSDSFNNRYIGESNITDNLAELKVKEDTLFKIKDGKIEKHYIGSLEVSKALSEL